MTSLASESQIGRVAEAMIACTLPAAEWTHAAHWAVALWLIARRSDLNPPEAMPEFIRRYNESCGNKNTATSSYHETITQASLRAGLAAFSDAPACESVSAALQRRLASPLGRSDWPLAFWSKERLMSKQARRERVDPDLAPFAFLEYPQRPAREA